MRLRRTPIGLSVAIILLLVAAVTSCGNESRETSDGGGTTTVGEGGAREGQFDDLEPIEAPDPCRVDPGISDDEIKVGTLYASSGESATSFNAAGDGIAARFLKENEENDGVGGRELVIEHADDVAEATRNGQAARQLVDSSEVFGVIEVSSASEGSAGFLNAEGVPVTGWAITPAWGAYTNMFGYRHSISPDPEGEATTRNAELLKTQGATSVALVGLANQASEAFINGVARTIEPAGLKLAYKTTDVPVGSTNFTADVQQIKDSGADALYTGMDFLQNVALVEQLQQAGVELKAIAFPGGYDPRVLQGFGEKLEGVTFGIDWRPFELELPAHDEFTTWLDRANPDAVPAQIAMVGWLSADLFIRGLREAGADCPTREAFINNLRLVDDYDADGLLVPVDFSEEFGTTPLCFFFVRIESGEFVPQFDGEPFCGELLNDDGG